MCVCFNCQTITEQATVSNFMTWNALNLLTPVLGEGLLARLNPPANSNLEGSQGKGSPRRGVNYVIKPKA